MQKKESYAIDQSKVESMYIFVSFQCSLRKTRSLSIARMCSACLEKSAPFRNACSAFIWRSIVAVIQ